MVHAELPNTYVYMYGTTDLNPILAVLPMITEEFLSVDFLEVLILEYSTIHRPGVLVNEQDTGSICSVECSARR